jgi:D-glycero-D-manno-heptose 1,7-bisphosphate phosphatase
MTAAARRPAIFIDRDGTLSHEVGYVNHVSRFRLYPWAVDAVRLANERGSSRSS